MDIIHTTDTYQFSNKKKINISNFLTQYDEAEFYKVTADKAFIYFDSAGAQSKKQYFERNDIVVRSYCYPLESNDYVYIEYLSANNKFVYGWIKKNDVKEIKNYHDKL